MENEFHRFKSKNYLSGVKGDFSKLNNADLIISIGWQSTALKAASIFNKPLLFYSKKVSHLKIISFLWMMKVI